MIKYGFLEQGLRMMSRKEREVVCTKRLRFARFTSRDCRVVFHFLCIHGNSSTDVFDIWENLRSLSLPYTCKSVSVRFPKRDILYSEFKQKRKAYSFIYHFATCSNRIQHLIRIFRHLSKLFNKKNYIKMKNKIVHYI